MFGQYVSSTIPHQCVRQKQEYFSCRFPFTLQLKKKKKKVKYRWVWGTLKNENLFDFLPFSCRNFSLDGFLPSKYVWNVFFCFCICFFLFAFFFFCFFSENFNMKEFQCCISKVSVCNKVLINLPHHGHIVLFVLWYIRGMTS